MPYVRPRRRPHGAAARGPSLPLIREPAPLQALTQRPAYVWFVVATVCVGAFMGQLDASIAQLVLPTLETTFHARLSLVDWVALAYLLALGATLPARLSLVDWVALAYLLALGATLPIFGRLADMVGRKLLYTGGFLVFVAGSALCGFAPTLYVLIGARVFQAIGAGLLQANSVAIITAAAGPARRGRAIGLQGAAQVIGLSLGPALGGVLIQTLGWRWVFWINVPAGLLGAVLGWFVLLQTRRLRPHQRFDGGGAVLLGPALTALLLAVNEGRRWGWTSPVVATVVIRAKYLLVDSLQNNGSAPTSPLYLCTFCLATTCCCPASVMTTISSGQKPFYLTIIEKCKDSEVLLAGSLDHKTYRSRKSKASSATGRPVGPTTAHSA